MPQIPVKVHLLLRVLAVLLELIFNPNKTFTDKELARAVGWRRRWTKSTEPEEPTNPLMEGVDQTREVATPASKNTMMVQASLYKQNTTPRPTRTAKAAHFAILCAAFLWLCSLILGTNNLDMDTLTFAETALRYLDEWLQKGYSLLLYAYQFFLTAFSAI